MSAAEVSAFLRDFLLHSTRLHHPGSLKADVTANDAVDQALMRRFSIIGPPATLFFGPDGREQRELRLIGFESADDFVIRLQRGR
jgi:thiol:disulfide interchange protein DsbD